MFFSNPARRGILFFCLHTITQVAILALSKPLMQTLSFGEVMFVRMLPAWIGMTLFIHFRPGLHPFQTKKLKGHMMRGGLGFANMVLLYLSVKLLPLSLAMTIRQLEAFLWVLLAAKVYGEKVTRLQWCALAAGFFGVLCVLRPSVEANITGTLVALACACTGAGVRVLSSELSKTEASSTIIFFNFTQWTILSLFLAPWDWAMPESSGWGLLLLSGLIILVSQWLATEGMALVGAPRLAPFRHTEILWAGLIGWLVWKEPISGWFVAGSALIVCGGIAANYKPRNRLVSDSIPQA